MILKVLPPVTLRDLVAPSAVVRTPGLHVSQIVQAIMRKVDAKYAKAYPQADSENWQETGFMWEDVLSEALVSRLGENQYRFRPGEIERDGVIGSPDAIEINIQPDDPVCVVAEFKCTWKSCRGWPDPRTADPSPSCLMDKRFLGYLLQMQAYCAMLGTTRARLYPLFINGDYTSYVPEMRGVYQIDFTPSELEEQWQSFLYTAVAEGWRT
jgi:hypothetical protein